MSLKIKDRNQVSMLCMITLREVLKLWIYCRHSLNSLQMQTMFFEAFGFILDRSNAETILKDKRIKISNIEFTYSTEKVLLLPTVRRRYENYNGFQMKIINKTRRFLSIEEVLGRAEPDNFIANTARFFKCVEPIFRTAHY